MNKLIFTFVIAFILMTSLTAFALAESGSGSDGTDSDDEIEDENEVEIEDESDNDSGSVRERMRQKIKNGESELRYEMRDGNKRFEYREKIKDGEIEFKIKGRDVTISDLSPTQREMIIGRINMRTGLNLTLEDVENQTIGQIMRVYMSNGRNAEVKIMPDTAAEMALKRLRAVCESRDDEDENDDDSDDDEDENETESDDDSNETEDSDDNECEIELKEVGNGEEKRLVYVVKTEKDSRVLFLFKKKMMVEAEVDAENGEIKVKKRWWSWLAKEKNSDDDEIESELNGTRVDKVLVCHKPTKQAVTISVAKPAVRAHLRHGDRLGACSGNNQTIGNETGNNQTQTNLSIILVKPIQNETFNMTEIPLSFLVSGNATGCFYGLDSDNETAIDCTDTVFNATEGNHSVYVKAVNGNVSAMSNTHSFSIVLPVVNNTNVSG